MRIDGATTPFELSKLFGVGAGLMARLLDNLEGKGLVERSRGVSDRRIVNLAPAEAGPAVVARIPEIASKVLDARMRKFTKVEFDELCRLPRKFSGE
ncbi:MULTISPECIES: MarR family winged helix-turn-helix transcriptional regulator [Burkholderia]|uniref:MarR family winged helix-turn-helix transcriptional regulator n=1 Tax=Burkholderia TaxID=32008 RepID=UPI0021DFB959|nr:MULTISPECIES: MarR family transcriptional regulator [Burkholderia]MCU9954897.1 MarR family transcriptional regulator [Burkholderia sp. BKH01]